MAKILLVDDDPQALESTRKILELTGFEVVTATDGQAALECVRPIPGKISSGFNLVITDVRMPRLGGIEFLRALSLCGETMPVILMTAFGRVEDAVWAMKLGAVDFLTKPFKRQTLISSIESALKRSKARTQENSVDPSMTSSKTELMIGRSEPMKQLKNLIDRIAVTHATVLLNGESGTGKELVARRIHQHSPRANSRLVTLNCSAVPEQLMESELFGFEKGAFTGAANAKEGLFETAHGGTLLLDEIGDMPISLQAKLLRVLQDGEVRRVGSTVSRHIDVRVIAATHKDLKQAITEGKFRQDLLYRLEVVGLHVPPLRERTQDIPDLAYHFLKTACRRHGKDVQGISGETMSFLERYSWPGNVRELSNVIERAVVFVNGPMVTPAELPTHLVSGVIATPVKSQSNSTISVPLGTSLKDVEELMIRKTLEATSGDKNMTAKLLGINSRTIYRRLDKRTEKELEPQLD